ncbi:MAG: hypothetical protein AB7O26_19675, partial [Planctomycetaceae bacterium]
MPLWRRTTALATAALCGALLTAGCDRPPDVLPPPAAPAPPAPAKPAPPKPAPVQKPEPAPVKGEVKEVTTPAATSAAKPETKPVAKAAGKAAAPPNREAPVSPVGPTSWATFRNGNQQLGIATSALPEKLELLWERPATD